MLRTYTSKVNKCEYLKNECVFIRKYALLIINVVFDTKGSCSQLLNLIVTIKNS